MTSRLTRRITSTHSPTSAPLLSHSSSPTVLNSLPISLYSHTLCSGASCHSAVIQPPSIRHPASYRRVTVLWLFSLGGSHGETVTPLHVLSHSPVRKRATSPLWCVSVPLHIGYILQTYKPRIEDGFCEQPPAVSNTAGPCTRPTTSTCWAPTPLSRCNPYGGEGDVP